jgi:hypothetical protein
MFCGAPLPWAAATAGASGGFVRTVYSSETVSPIADPSGAAEPRYHGYSSLSHDDPSDKPELWIAIVSFLIPLAGIILYFTNAGRAPKRASSASRGLLWGMICSLLLGLGAVLMARRALELMAVGSPNHMVTSVAPPPGY